MKNIFCVQLTSIDIWKSDFRNVSADLVHRRISTEHERPDGAGDRPGEHATELAGRVQHVDAERGGPSPEGRPWGRRAPPTVQRLLRQRQPQEQHRARQGRR